MADKDNENNTNKNMITWIAVAIVCGGLWVVLGNQETNYLDKPYSHFTKNLGNVTEFVLREDARSFGYVLKDDTMIYETAFPPGKSSILIDELQAQGTVIHIEPPPEATGMGTMILISIVPVFFLIGALVWLSRRSASAATAMGSSPVRLISPEENTTTLADVAGNPGDFDEIHELVEFLHNPQKFWAADAELPHGVLLYGPPGCGKTLLARAIAGEANVPFYVTSGSEFVEMFVGVGASRVRSMFAELKKNSPAILFIDEIDALGNTRDGIGGGNREHGQTLNQLLVEMDGFDGHASVMVIGATNRPDTLDPALLRPGRFDRSLPIGLPDLNAREKILEVHTKKRKLEDDVDLRIIAKGTPSFSGADLKNLVNEAAMVVAKNERSVMQMSDLDSARDRILMGKEKSLEMSVREKEMTAFHEAGHALVGHKMPEHDPIYKISIVPRGRALGVTMYLPEADVYSHSRQYLNSQIVSLMGGRAAEELQYGVDAVTTGASNDLERATDLARNMVTKWGFSESGLISFRDRDYDMLSEDTKQKIDEQVRELLDNAYKKAYDLLKRHKKKLTDVALALVEQETIDFSEFKMLIGEEDDTK